MTYPSLPNFLQFLEKEVEKRRSDAAYSGSMSDNGASILEDQIAVYKAGTGSFIPKVWSDLFEKFRYESDPEWETYQRLKNKFEAK